MGSETKPEEISRRRFVESLSVGASALMIVPRHVLGGPGYTAPTDRLNIACIGVGGKGRSDVRGVSSENVYALCDVDHDRGGESFLNFPKAKRYTDYREMLEKEESNIDAVTVSTPDHTHTHASVMAMRMNKHVFCQKPLTRTIHESRLMARTAREHGVATQMGIQGHAGEGMRIIREWVEAEIVGTIREVHYWTNRPIWPQAIERPLEKYYVPDDLNWDLWFGPAPERPYHPAYVPFRWRGWKDFGTGALGDIACHAMDAAFWTLDLGAPTRIQAETTAVFEETYPLVSRIVYDFPAKGNRPAIKVVWRDGNLAPSRPPQLSPDRAWPFGNSGQLLVGEEGMITAGIYGNDPQIIPQSKHEAVMANPVPKKYPRSPGLYEEWIEACKGGKPAGANFSDYASPLTEMVLIGNLAVLTGEVIEWDAEMGRVSNVQEANKHLRDEYRRGWEL